MRYDWQIKPFMDKIERENQEACKRGAQIVAKSARSRCPVETGDLVNSIKVRKSKHEGGGYIVLTGGKVGGKDTFYWRWVHYGANKKRSIPRRPYMTQALESSRDKILKEFKDII